MGTAGLQPCRAGGGCRCGGQNMRACWPAVRRAPRVGVIEVFHGVSGPSGGKQKRACWPRSRWIGGQDRAADQP